CCPRRPAYGDASAEDPSFPFLPLALPRSILNPPEWMILPDHPIVAIGVHHPIHVADVPKRCRTRSHGPARRNHVNVWQIAECRSLLPVIPVRRAPPGLPATCAR